MKYRVIEKGGQPGVVAHTISPSTGRGRRISEFEDSQGSTEKPCLEKTKTKQKKKKKKERKKKKRKEKRKEKGGQTDIFFFFFLQNRGWNQGLAQARQVFYH